MSSKPEKPKLKSPPVRLTQNQQETTPKNYNKLVVKPQKQNKISNAGGGKGNDNNNRGKGGGGGNNNNYNREPLPWIKDNPTPHSSASFVEYLRWLRVKKDDTNNKKNKAINYGTILELIQKIETRDYSERLNKLTERTKDLAHDFFEVRCSWRIRVGGIKAPESMLLPAFDALGMPYIPSSSLRGVAREMAKQDRKCSEAEFKQTFGDIDSDTTQMGQVIFLDAYPLPGKNSQGGLEADMTNPIWEWKNNDIPQYNPKPNTFLSLKEPTFIVGLRRTKNCSETTLNKVKSWLIKGLAQGIGSRINSGYGALKPKDRELGRQAIVKKTIIRVPFKFEGQLIHGQQEFDRWEPKNNNWQLKSNSVSEVRPTAFRCMLRYWFRVFTLGILPVSAAKNLEMEIFGGIDVEPGSDPFYGLFRLETTGKQENKDNDDDPPLMSGNMIIRHNSQSYGKSAGEREYLEKLLTSLTWLMFHLGGVGQGARRPCYCRGYIYRNGRKEKNNPFWRGSNLIPDPNCEYELWNLPNTLLEFKSLFQNHLLDFYNALNKYSNLEINSNQLKTIFTSNWIEAADKNCHIFICKKDKHQEKKNFSLFWLHHNNFKIEGTDRNGNPILDYDPELCGGIKPPKPSPVWIRSLDYDKDWQVLTVFGADKSPRSDFLDLLEKKADECYQIFPF